MIRNYFKIAWRNLNKHKVFSFINITGLAVGMAAFCIIALYVADELSFDRFNTKADRIFRVVQHGTWNGGKFDLAITSAPYASALKSDYPEVEDAVRMQGEGGGRITYGEKTIEAGNVSFADNAIFNIFTYHFIAGDPKTALQKPRSIVLTKTLAERIFGDAEQALNKTITFDGNTPNLVTGVMDDVPANSHIGFQGLRSFDTNYTESWGSADLNTYVLLKDHDDYKKIEAASGSFFNKYLKAAFANVRFRLELQPVTDIHLHSKLDYDSPNNGNITYVYVFSIVGLLILAIAIINYMNLATARSAIRIREIGVRKVIGSNRKQLMALFFVESVLLAYLATVVAIVTIRFVMPYFNQLSGKTLTVWQYGLVPSLAGFAAFAVFIGLLSGVYPALFLSGFKTIPAMKGQLGDQTSTVFFRKSLVVFQFVITIVMIVGSCVIYSQLHYMLNTDLGFNKEQVLTFHINKQARAQVASIKQQMLQNPLIEAVGVAGNPIGNNDIGSRDFNLDASGNTGADTKMVENLVADEDFIPTMQIKMLKGRNFMPNSPADKADAIIVNETLVNELGWKNPVGMRIRMGSEGDKPVMAAIIGVIKDFNTYSLQHKITPMVLSMPPQVNDGDNLYIRIGKHHIQEALSHIARVYSGYDSEKPEFHFLDQNFAKQYQVEQKQGNLLMIFTILAISIACMGLFGLVTFTAQQRTKEIGIRKVLGASVNSIVTLLSRDLIKLVLIAALIATPVAWWAMHLWLQNFAYRTGIHPWMFLLAGAVAVIIAFVTVGFQSAKAALSNPVKSLRNE